MGCDLMGSSASNFKIIRWRETYAARLDFLMSLTLAKCLTVCAGLGLGLLNLGQLEEVAEVRRRYRLRPRM